MEAASSGKSAPVLFSNHRHLMHIKHILQNFKQSKGKDRSTSNQMTKTNEDKLITFMHDYRKQ